MWDDANAAPPARECLVISLLDATGVEISRINIAGCADTVAIALPTLARAMLACACRYLILIHNHPTRSIRSRWSTHKHAETLANSGIFGIA